MYISMILDDKSTSRVSRSKCPLWDAACHHLAVEAWRSWLTTLVRLNLDRQATFVKPMAIGQTAVVWSWLLLPSCWCPLLVSFQILLLLVRWRTFASTLGAKRKTGVVLAPDSVFLSHLFINGWSSYCISYLNISLCFILMILLD